MPLWTGALVVGHQRTLRILFPSAYKFLLAGPKC